jgi:hypothetical protein
MQIKVLTLRCGLAFISVLGWQSILSAITITDLLKGSDTVVVGTPTSFSDHDDGTLINISIMSWLSSPPPGATATIDVLWTARADIRQTWAKVRAATGPGIWFLKNINGVYSPVVVRATGNRPPGFPDLYFEAAPSGQCAGSFAYAYDAAVAEKIALKMACAASIEKTNEQPGSMVEATRGLGTSPRVHDALTFLSEMPFSRPKAIGIAGLLNANDPAGITALSNHVTEINQADLDRVVAGVLYAYWRNPASTAVTGLGQAATAPSASGMFLKSAATALAAIHTRDTVPYLAQLLDSNNSDIQIEAILGLVQFVNGYPVRTRENVINGAAIMPSATPYSSDASWKQYAVGRNASTSDVHQAALFWKGWLRTHQLIP